MDKCSSSCYKASRAGPGDEIEQTIELLKTFAEHAHLTHPRRAYPRPHVVRRQLLFGVDRVDGCTTVTAERILSAAESAFAGDG